MPSVAAPPNFRRLARRRDLRSSLKESSQQ
jgi:hypothetical protein